jgi:hypothetical protein
MSIAAAVLSEDDQKSRPRFWHLADFESILTWHCISGTEWDIDEIPTDSPHFRNWLDCTLRICPAPKWGWGRIRGSAEIAYPAKARHIKHNLSAEKPTRYLDPFTSQSSSMFCVEGQPHICWRSWARGRVWYLLKVLHIMHNLFAGTETLYRLASFGFGKPTPIWGWRGGDRGTKWSHSKCTIDFLFKLPIVTKALSLTLLTPFRNVTARQTNIHLYNSN